MLACVSPANGVRAGAGRHQAVDRPDDRRRRQLEPLARARGAQPVGPADRAAGARRRRAAATGLPGESAPAQFLKGKLQRLTAPMVDVRGDATLEDRILDGQLTLGSPSLRAVARGAVDLAENRYREVRLGVDLLRPPALFPNMTGRNVRMVWTLDGPFATRRLFLSADLAGGEVRQHRLRRRARRGAGAARRLADARAAAAAGAGDHRRRRRRRRDPRQCRGSKAC